VRIGDFGLATSFPETTATQQSSTELPVGTAIYHPTGVTSHSSPSLDIYALGIITFELLWPFSTKMERQDTLQRLKQGVFPAGFRKRFAGTDVEGCIQNMLSLKEVNVDNLMRRLQEIRDGPEAAAI
jgi:eukaryotic translation initiation factor 2-alpha kinase 3